MKRKHRRLARQARWGEDRLKLALAIVKVEGPPEYKGARNRGGGGAGETRLERKILVSVLPFMFGLFLSEICSWEGVGVFNSFSMWN